MGVNVERTGNKSIARQGEAVVQFFYSTQSIWARGPISTQGIQDIRDCLDEIQKECGA